MAEYRASNGARERAALMAAMLHNRKTGRCVIVFEGDSRKWTRHRAARRR